MLIEILVVAFDGDDDRQTSDDQQMLKWMMVLLLLDLCFEDLLLLSRMTLSITRLIFHGLNQPISPIISSLESPFVIVAVLKSVYEQE